MPVVTRVTQLLTSIPEGHISSFTDDGDHVLTARYVSNKVKSMTLATWILFPNPNGYSDSCRIADSCCWPAWWSKYITVPCPQRIRLKRINWVVCLNPGLSKNSRFTVLVHYCPDFQGSKYKLWTSKLQSKSVYVSLETRIWIKGLTPGWY